MNVFWRLMGFLRPYRRGAIASLVLACLAMTTTTAIPYLTGQVVDEIRAKDSSALTPLVIAIAGVALARLILTVGRRLIAGKVSLGIEYDLRGLIYNHLQSLELGFFNRHQTGQLMSRATVDLQAVRFFLGYGLIFITQSVLTILLATTAMFLIDAPLAAAALWPVPLVVAIAFRYGRRSRPSLQEVQQRIAELTADVEENISGVRLIKAFAREPLQLERFKHSTQRVFSQSMEATKLRAFYSPLIGFLPSLGLAAILLLGGRAVISGSLTLGEFTAFYTYLIMLTGPMRQLGMALGMSQRATASGTRIFELLDTEPQLTVPPHAIPLPDGPGSVELKGVSFSYNDNEHPALTDINLSVAAGKTVAVVGGTGSGKTSLISLIARLYDPTRGSIEIDGVNVTEIKPASLRQAVALVTDDPFLFSLTVGENIAYGRPDAIQAEIEQAAKQAQAHDFIVALPDGYDTVVGERGLTLSGGQRQRIAIARALICNPRVLILDDATSSVDPTTESEIRKGLQAAMKGRTTFIIAHRLSTVALADEIVVLENGSIAAQGTHSELLANSPLYREIVDKGLPESVFLVERPTEPQAAEV